MIISEFTVLLVVFAATFIIHSTVLWANVLRSKNTEQHLFKLYELRDRISKCVLIGKLSADSTTFKLLYPAIISSLSDVKHHNLSLLLNMEASKEEQVVQNLERLRQGMENEDEHVKELMRDYSWTMANILIHSSISFYMFVRLSSKLMNLYGGNSSKSNNGTSFVYIKGAQTYRNYLKYTYI